MQLVLLKALPVLLKVQFILQSNTVQHTGWQFYHTQNSSTWTSRLQCWEIRSTEKCQESSQILWSYSWIPL